MADRNGKSSPPLEGGAPGSRRHEALSNLVDEGVCRLDASGTLVAVDDSLVALLGRARETLLGDHCSAMVVEPHRSRVETAIDRCGSDAEPTTVDVRCETGDGGAIPCELRLDEFGDGEKRYVGVVQERPQEPDQRLEERKSTDSEDAPKDAGRQPASVKMQSGATELRSETGERLAPGIFDRVLRQSAMAVGIVEADGTVTRAEGRADDVFALVEADAVAERAAGAVDGAGGPVGDAEGGVSGEPTEGPGIYGRDGAPVPPGERPHAQVIETGEPVGDVVYRVEDAEGHSRWLSVTAIPVAEDDGALVVTHDVTGLAEQTQRLEQRTEAQRQQLTALSDLNWLVGEVTTRLVEQSTREEIEETVCERLARADHFDLAWIARGDFHAEDAGVRTAAGRETYLDDVDVDLEDGTDEWPACRAFRTGEVQVVRDAPDAQGFEEWRETAREHDVRAAAAVPITHEDALYGVLTVCASRTDSFAGEKRDVVAQLGDIVGHAIAAVERKRALTNDEVTELEFRIPDVLERRGLPAGDGTIRIERTVPAGDGTYIEYGTASPDMVETVEAFDEAFSHWEDVELVGDSFDGVRFEGRLSEPPLNTTIASKGDRVAESVIEDGDHHVVVHAQQGTDVRSVVETVREMHPTAEFLSKHQITEQNVSSRSFRQELLDELTPRQRTVVESAYFAGFFEWPRESTGEAVAASLDIAPSTFHQHLRKAEQSILRMLLSETTVAE